MENVKALYDSLVDSGEIFGMFSEAKGEWSKDKKFFTKYYESNQEIINNMSLDLDDEEDVYNEDEY